MTLIECKRLSVGYDKKVVCKDINFKVEEGDYLCILGENGSGKSTLLKTILGLNKAVFGKVIFEKSLSKNKLGYLPQQNDFQKDFPATVKEVIMSGFISQMGLRPFYNKAEKNKANGIIEFLGLENLTKNGFKELSGGQQQRVLLARALCATDKILVLDEPTNGLDSKTTNQFYKLLKNLNNSGLTIIMVSHNLDKVMEYASHIVYLKDSMIFNGTKQEFESSDIMSALKVGE
ncbi:MAG TPA: ABC transporter [Clostridiales bacterium]|nr:ABC transporter [Clostridiales bacterium]